MKSVGIINEIKNVLLLENPHHSPILIWNDFEPRSMSMEKLISSLPDSPLGASISLPQMAL